MNISAPAIALAVGIAFFEGVFLIAADQYKAGVREFGVRACFEIYNNRPHNPDGTLPWSGEAMKLADQCFKALTP